MKNKSLSKKIFTEHKGKLMERDLTERDVIREFNKVSFYSILTGREYFDDDGILRKERDTGRRQPGSFCERCGRLFGPDKTYQEGKHWRSFYICQECFDNKMNGELENTPDLEDLIKVRNGQPLY